MTQVNDLSSLQIHKYVAAGNDFIIFRSERDIFDRHPETVQALCDRRFGVGADGVLLLGECLEADFRMHYYNADGSRGEMCGNGARSLVHYAMMHGKAGNKGHFLADDGLHGYRLTDDQIWVEILVNDDLHEVNLPDRNSRFINTGVPHLILPVIDLQNMDIDTPAVNLNHDPLFREGVNVNFIEDGSRGMRVRTWERGVNAETLACGTGATACAIYSHSLLNKKWPISLAFQGGRLDVNFIEDRYWLSGPVKLVFHGELAELPDDNIKV